MTDIGFAIMEIVVGYAVGWSFGGWIMDESGYRDRIYAGLDRLYERYLEWKLRREFERAFPDMPWEVTIRVKIVPKTDAPLRVTTENNDD